MKVIFFLSQHKSPSTRGWRGVEKAPRHGKLVPHPDGGFLVDSELNEGRLVVQRTETGRLHDRQDTRVLLPTLLDGHPWGPF